MLGVAQALIEAGKQKSTATVDFCLPPSSGVPRGVTNTGTA
jgi:hypothetical protein